MGASQQPSAAQSEQDLSEALDVDPDEYDWVREQLESAGIQLQHARLDDAADGDDDDEEEEGAGNDAPGAWRDPSEGGALAELLRTLEDDGGADEDEQPLVERVRALLDRLSPKACVSLPGPDADTALHLAALYGRARVAALLLEAGADPLVENPEDKTLALHDAAAGGYDEIVEMLLEKAGGEGGKGLNAPDEDGDTPLHAAARGGHLSTVLRLLKAGANTSAVNEKGCTPRDESDDEKVRALLERVEEKGGEAAAGAGGAS
jgi:hypothetical protein